MKKSRRKQIEKIIKEIKPYLKMDRKIINFDDIEIEEYEFHQC